MKEIEERLEAVEAALEMAGIAKKEVLTLAELSKYTGLSRSYLYKLTMRRVIPHSKPAGKMLFFRREEIEIWLLQNRVSTAEEISSKAVAYCSKNPSHGR
jgi:excisionase family DNA binding protein